PVDIWHAAGRLETPRRCRQPALRNAGLDRDPEYFPVSDCASDGLAADRSAVSAVAAPLGTRAAADRAAAAALDLARRGALADFLRAFHGDRFDYLRDRFRAREGRRLDAAGSIDHPAFLLPPDDVCG